jgi:hypothetical protein
MPATGLSVSQFGDSTMSLGFSLAENGHIVQSHQPQTVAPTTTVNGDVISMKDYVRAEFLLSIGDMDGTVSDGLITVEACDDFVPTAVEAIPFRIYKEETPAGDTLDGGADVLAAGYTVPFADNIHYLIEVLDEHLPEGKPNVRLVFHSVSGGTTGSLMHCAALLTGARSASQASPTVIA